MLPLALLRRMRETVERFAANVSPFADGTFVDCGGGWSAKDECLRSLLEASIYLGEWIAYRKNHGRDPVKGA